MVNRMLVLRLMCPFSGPTPPINASEEELTNYGPGSEGPPEKRNGGATEEAGVHACSEGNPE